MEGSPVKSVSHPMHAVNASHMEGLVEPRALHPSLHHRRSEPYARTLLTRAGQTHTNTTNAVQLKSGSMPHPLCLLPVLWRMQQWLQTPLGAQPHGFPIAPTTPRTLEHPVEQQYLQQPALQQVSE